MKRHFVSLFVTGLFLGWLCSASTRAGDNAKPDNRPHLVAQLGHSHRVNCVAFSPDCKQMLTGSSDKTAILWDAASAKMLRTFSVGDEVSSVAFSPDGKHVLTGSRIHLDGGTWDVAVLWDAGTGQKRRGFQGWGGNGVHSVRFSPNGK